jgi:hypothetical protein
MDKVTMDKVVFGFHQTLVLLSKDLTKIVMLTLQQKNKVTHYWRLNPFSNFDTALAKGALISESF